MILINLGVIYNPKISHIYNIFLLQLFNTIILWKEEDKINNIKIIGSNCSNGIKLKKILDRLSQDKNIIIEEMNDTKSRNRFGVNNIPGLVINNKLISQGKVLTIREIEHALA